MLVVTEEKKKNTRRGLQQDLLGLRPLHQESPDTLQAARTGSFVDGGLPHIVLVGGRAYVMPWQRKIHSVLHPKHCTRNIVFLSGPKHSRIILSTVPD